MANQTGRPVAPARKLVAAVLGTFAVFVMVFGLGLSSWPIVALGAALLALAIALGMVNVVRRGARAWVAGHGQVKAISEPPGSGAYGRAEMQLVVVAPGLSVTEVMVREPRIPVGKWPRPGETLPITVDVDDLRRVRIDWSQVDDRAVDGDPPPPSFEPAEEFIDDDLLGDPEPPPWANRDRSWGRGPAEPSSPAADYPEYADEELHQSSVVVHDTPGGPVVEGTVVNEDDIPRVLPQRAPRPAHPPAAPPTSPADPSSTSSPASSPASPPPSSPADADAPRSSADAAAYPAPSAAEASPSAAAPSSAAAEQASASTATVDDEQSSPAETESMPDAQPPPAETERRRPSPRPRKPSEPTSEETPDPFSGTPSGPTNATPAPGTPQPGVVPEQRGGGDAGYDSPPPEPAAARSAPVDHEIDLPLDDQSHRGDPTTDLPLIGDPEPAPEFGPEAREAVDEGVIAPPADADPPPAGRAWVVGSTAASPPTRDAPFPDSDDVAAYPASAASESTPDAEVTRPAPTRNDPPRDTDVAATANQATPDADDTPSSPDPDEVAAYPAGQAPPAPDGEYQAPPNPDDVAAYPATPQDADAEAPIAPHAARPWEASSNTPDPEATAPPTDQKAEAPVITGVDAPVESRGPSTGAAGAGAAAAAAAAAAASRSEDKPDAQHGPGSPWADLEGGGYQPDEHADEIITAYPSARPGPAGAIHGVGITVLVTDLDRSTAFYRDTLGFFQIDNGPGSAVLASGDTRLVLRTVHSLASDIGRLIYLNLEVGDVDAVYDELKAKGVKFLHGPRPVNRGDKLELWAATFYDPDGHNIAVTQWRAIR